MVGGGGGGDGWAVLTAANRHCFSKAWGVGGACLGLGVPLSQAHSHLKEALGQEAGRQGYSLETGRTSRALEGRLESVHTEGPGSLRQHVPSRPAGSPPRGSSSGPALGTGTSPTQPSQCTLPPLCSEKAAAGAV